MDSADRIDISECHEAECWKHGEKEPCSQCPPIEQSGLAGELEELLENASAAPWAYRPDEYDDWGVIRGPEKTVDWADYPVRPHIARARNSDIQDEEYLAECRASKTDPWAGDAKLIVWLRNHADAILTALTADKATDEALEEAGRTLELAEQFIENGFDLGYIRMPDKDTPDAAHNMLPIIAKTLARIRSLKGAAK